MKTFSENEIEQVYSFFDKGRLYVFPFLDTIQGSLLKNKDQINILSQHSDKTEYFPDLDLVAQQIDGKKSVLQISVFELDINNEQKERENMEWFYNGRKTPDRVQIVVQDCYFCDNKTIVNEKLKNRFSKVEESIPKREEIGIYEILPLPVQKINANINPAEFQAVIDWAFSPQDNIKSNGALIFKDDSTVLNKKGKIKVM